MLAIRERTVTEMQAWHIVVGADFSEGAARALDVAISIARTSGAAVTVVHAVADDEIELATAEHRLAEIVDARRAGGVAIAGQCRRGRPWDKVENVATELGAPLIVVGRRGAGARSGEASNIGSVAERILRTSHRSVLAVAPDIGFRRR